MADPANSAPVRKTRQRGAPRRFSLRETEAIVRRLPLNRPYGPLEAAMAAAQYLKPDPAFFVDQCHAADIYPYAHRDKIGFHYPFGRGEAGAFLMVWLSQSGCTEAVAKYLEGRALPIFHQEV